MMKVNEGMDKCIQSMKKEEICEVLCTGVYGAENHIDTLVPKHILEEVARPLISAGAALKLHIELVNFIPQLDIHKDKGVIKRMMIRATNLKGLGWPGDQDEIVVAVTIQVWTKNGRGKSDELLLGRYR